MTLPQPRTIMGFHRDVAVVAVPADAGDCGPVKVTGSAPDYDGAALVDGVADAEAAVPPVVKGNEGRFLQFDFGQPRTVRAVRFLYAKDPPFLQMDPKKMIGEWQASDDGETFRTLRKAHLRWRYSATHHKEGPAVCAMTVALPETRARFLRFLLPPRSPGNCRRWCFPPLPAPITRKRRPATLISASMVRKPGCSMSSRASFLPVPPRTARCRWTR
jgi:hypothetical protein